MLKKKNLLIAVGVGLALYLFYRNRSKSKQIQSSEEGGEVKPPVSPSEALGKSYIGKGAFAKTDNTYVRNDALVNNDKPPFDFINNIVGVLKKDEFAGIIEKMIIGKDGKYWYYVNKGQNFDCPLLQCGITMPTKKGWIRSDVVNVK